MTDPWEDIHSFAPSEFDSPDAPGSGLLMNIEFIHLLDKIRAKCGFPFIINSGYRTSSHNAEVKGKSESAHTKGVAVDIAAMTSGERKSIVKNALDMGICRIGIGSNFVHLDMDYTLPQDVIWLYDKVV